MPELPLISIADLFSTRREDRRGVADQIGNAAREFGFFRICDHGIELEMIEQTYAIAKEFFDQEEDKKRRYYIGNSSNHRGYVPFTEKGDYPDEVNRNYEAFDLGLDLPSDDPDYLDGNRVLGPNVWPDYPGFKSIVSAYYAKISGVGRLVCRALEMHLNLPDGALTNEMTKPISQLRLLHYVRNQNTKDARSVNMGAHTDYECLTLLHTRNPGLQVMTSNDTWIDVPVAPNVFVVNIGDMLEAWSNGLLRSTPHRVLNLSPERYSMPYFVAANYNTVIKPFPQLVTKERPSRYEPFRAGLHLERMLIRDFPYLRNKVQPHLALKGGVTNNPFESRLQQS